MYQSWEHPPSSLFRTIPINYPGHGKRFKEPLCRKIEDLSTDIIQTILPIVSSSRFMLFGHSMGATVAFDVAQRLLERHSLSPEVLFVSGRIAPGHDSSILNRHLWTDSRIIAEMESLDGTPHELMQSPELLNLILPIIRADYEIIDRYAQYDSRQLLCPIIALAGREDKGIVPETLSSWRRYTSGGFSSHTFPGAHFYIRDNQSEVLQFITDKLISVSLQG